MPQMFISSALERTYLLLSKDLAAKDITKVVTQLLVTQLNTADSVEISLQIAEDTMQLFIIQFNNGDSTGYSCPSLFLDFLQCDCCKELFQKSSSERAMRGLQYCFFRIINRLRKAS